MGAVTLLQQLSAFVGQLIDIIDDALDVFPDDEYDTPVPYIPASPPLAVA